MAIELNEVTSTTNQKAKSTLDLTNVGPTEKNQEQLGDPTQNLRNLSTFPTNHTKSDGCSWARENETQPKICEIEATFYYKLDEQQVFIGMKIAHVWSLL